MSVWFLLLVHLFVIFVTVLIGVLITRQNAAHLSKSLVVISWVVAAVVFFLSFGMLYIGIATAGEDAEVGLLNTWWQGVVPSILSLGVLFLIQTFGKKKDN